MPGRSIQARVLVAWDGSSYVDESVRLLSVQGTVSLAAPGSSIVSPRGTAHTCRVELDNAGRRYSPFNAASPLFNSLRDGGSWQRPCQFDVRIDAGAWTRVFTGVLRLPQEGGLAYAAAPSVTLEVRSREELLLNRRMSTPWSTFVTLYGASEAQVITQWLADAGIGAGERAIDGGLMAIPLSWLDDDSPIEDCWQLAAAAGGRFYCDHTGKFCYENAQHWVLPPHTTSVATLTPGAHYARLSIGVAEDDLFSDAVVEVNERVMGAPGVLWEPDELVQVAPGTTRVVTATYRAPAAEVTGLTWTATTPGGNALGGVTVTPVYYAQRAELTVVNGSSASAVVLRSLRITGRPWVGGRRSEERAGTTLDYWTGRQRRTRRVAGNLAVQSAAQGRMLAQMVRDWSKLPRWKYRLEGVVGDPALRLGDRITIDDANVLGVGASRDAHITRIQFAYSLAGGYQCTIEAVDAALSIWQAHEYLVLGTHTVGSAQRAYY